jgi:transcription antitermination factor NusG
MSNIFCIYELIRGVAVRWLHEPCKCQMLAPAPRFPSWEPRGLPIGGRVHVTVSDICGSSPAPSRSSRGAAPDVSMRAWWAAAGSAPIPEFRSAISEDVDINRVREPWWHAVRFNHSRARVLEPLLGIINLNYRLFTYEFQRPRRPPTIRSWLPGYFFIEFDMLHDAWGQLNRIPGVIEILKRPLEAELIDDLVDRLPKRVNALVSECESVPRGSPVRIKSGTFEGHTASVTWSERKRVKIVMMAFSLIGRLKLKCAREMWRLWRERCSRKR